MSAPSRPNTRSRRNIQQTKNETKVTPSPPSSKRRRGATTSTTPCKTTTNIVSSVSSSLKQSPPHTTVIETPKDTVVPEVTVGLDQKQPATLSSPPPVAVDPKLSFKNPQYQFDKAVGKKKSKGWKSLRQIIAAEKAQGQATYGSIDAPPSLKPAKKYSDISGLEAKYTDPHTKLRYTNAEEYSRIQLLPTDIVQGLLSLRKANSIVS